MSERNEVKAMLPDGATVAVADALGQMVGTRNASQSETFRRDASVVIGAALPYVREGIAAAIESRTKGGKAVGYDEGWNDALDIAAQIVRDWSLRQDTFIWDQDGRRLR